MDSPCVASVDQDIVQQCNDLRGRLFEHFSELFLGDQVLAEAELLQVPHHLKHQVSALRVLRKHRSEDHRVALGLILFFFILPSNNILDF